MTLRLASLPLLGRFETSFGAVTAKTCVLVEVSCAGGVTGWGECVADTDPYYSEETTETAWHMLRDFLVPLVLGAVVNDARDVSTLMRRVRGNRMARACLEMALWDAFALASGLPLYRFLGGTRCRIPCGVSIGMPQSRSVDDLLREVGMRVDQGYRRVKIKIAPGFDVAPMRAVRSRFPSILLMADANSAYSLADVGTLRALDELELMMIEQPLGHDDIIDHAALALELRTPLCLDESVHHAEAARQALDLGACGVINVKPGRVGGFSESLRIEALCRERAVPLWVGGMLETGIGRGHNLALASLSGVTMPGDTSDSRRYFAEDVVEPRAEMDEAGFITLRDVPGSGFEPIIGRVEACTLRQEVLRS